MEISSDFSDVITAFPSDVCFKKFKIFIAFSGFRDCIVFPWGKCHDRKRILEKTGRDGVYLSSEISILLSCSAGKMEIVTSSIALIPDARASVSRFTHSA